MLQNPFIQIRSAKFGILDGEADELVNEGTYGKAFAQYLQEQLANRGYATPSVVCEDWGWWVTLAGLPFACGLTVYGSQIDGTKNLDLCVSVSTPAGRKWSWRNFKFIDTTADVRRLHLTLREILQQDPDITFIQETEEFPLA